MKKAISKNKKQVLSKQAGGKPVPKQWYNKALKYTLITFVIFFILALVVLVGFLSGVDINHEHSHQNDQKQHLD